jgi:predicted small secreted protein
MLRIVGACMMLLTLVMVVGCNTVEGAGEDIESAGDAIEDAAD